MAVTTLYLQCDQLTRGWPVNGVDKFEVSVDSVVAFGLLAKKPVQIKRGGGVGESYALQCGKVSGAYLHGRGLDGLRARACRFSCMLNHHAVA
jgi:hypothetical protein